MKEKGAADSSLFTTFKRRMANTNISNNDKEIRVPSSSRVSIVSKNPEADTILTSELTRFKRYFESSTSDIAVETVGSNDPTQNAIVLNLPRGIAIDSANNVFIADTSNHRILRVDSGTGIITTFAGTGTSGFSGDEGPAISATLNNPRGLALDPSGNLLIADSSNHRIRRVAAGTNIITTVAGNGSNTPYSGDGEVATLATLHSPSGVAVSSTGDIFIADSGNNRIRRVAAGTNIITRIAGNGTPFNDDNGLLANITALFAPQSVLIDPNGNIIILDTGNHRVRRINGVTGIMEGVAGSGLQGLIGDGVVATSPTVRFSIPSHAVYDAAGNLFILDTNNSIIRVITASTGILTTVVGTPGEQGFVGDGGPAKGPPTRLFGPNALAIDSSGNIFIGDTENNRIRRVAAGTNIITTLNTGFYSVGRSLNSYYLSSPQGVAVYGDNVYITTVRTIVVSNKSTRQITNLYGTGTIGLLGYNPGDLKFNNPHRTAIRSDGNIYVADSTGNRIHMIVVSNGAATKIAGGGADNPTNRDTSSGIARFKFLNGPRGVAVYGDILYFTNTQENTVCKVVINNANLNSSTISNLAGTYLLPEGLAVDSTGNVYVANTGLNKITWVTPGNIATDIQLPDGVTLNSPRGVAIDSTGQLHIADSGNNRVIRLNIDNTVTVLATGLNNPHDVSVNTDGTVYVADTDNNRIVEIKETITKFSGYV